MNTEIKLVSLDVDGTLVDDEKNIPERNLRAISWAHINNGVHFAINSGRICQSVRSYMEKLGVHESFPSLGGVLVHGWDGEIIAESTIDSSVALEINALARSLGCATFIYQRDIWCLDPGNDYWKNSEYTATKVMGRIVDTDKAIKTGPTNKMLGVCLDTAKLQRLMEGIISDFSTFVDCFTSSPYFLEILPKGVNKGTAIDILIKHYGIKKENVMSIGDYYNDVDMFKTSGISVAMANAPDDIKAMADYVTEADNCNCGVAEAIHRFIK